jgi:DNA polymerase-1
VDAATSDLILAGVKRPNGSKDTARIKQLVEAAYMAKGQGAPRTEKGAIRTSEAVLRDCGDPTLRQLAEIMADEKELSAFVPVLEQGASAPIHAFWRVLGAASGRTSCTGPNLQQQPRRAGVRECYIPRAGNVFVAADYSIAELRALAQLLLWKYGQSQMADAIRAGHDLHLVTGAEIIGWTYGQIAEAYAAGDKEAKQARQLAKAANFGYPGGLGAETFIAFAHASYGIEISESQARQLKDQWLSAYPEMRLYFADVGALIGARGGRATVAHAVSGRVRGACNFTAACNTFFQGLVADGAKRALYLLTRAAYAERYDLHVRPVAFIHDEIIIECPESQATEAARLLVDCMTKGMSAYTPDIPVVVEAAAMRRWFKDAAPVWDGDRLIPWEPGQAKKELHWRASE